MVKRKNYGMINFQVGVSVKEHEKAMRVLNWYKGFINEDKRQVQKDFRYKTKITKTHKRDCFVALINDVLEWKLGEKSEFELEAQKILKSMEEEKEPKLKPKSEPGAHNV